MFGGLRGAAVANAASVHNDCPYDLEQSGEFRKPRYVHEHRAIRGERRQHGIGDISRWFGFAHDGNVEQQWPRDVVE